MRPPTTPPGRSMPPPKLTILKKQPPPLPKNPPPSTPPPPQQASTSKKTPPPSCSKSPQKKRQRSPSAGSSEEEIAIKKHPKNERKKKKQKFKQGEDVCRVDEDILDNNNNLQPQQLKGLRVLLNFKTVNGKSIEDPRNFPKAKDNDSDKEGSGVRGSNRNDKRSCPDLRPYCRSCRKRAVFKKFNWEVTLPFAPIPL